MKDTNASIGVSQDASITSLLSVLGERTWGVETGGGTSGGVRGLREGDCDGPVWEGDEGG
eukprot:CAMPEP_0114378330 /NCGR_PEP_ID=MMETSP0102-20121206/1558_1 /TAXON_ID=38822 ORGANISM="Pteridomonas danica, Strain PT" /NCGR_SAMPLE_ID=MMETSP0102 /ASSEMBLY_ACC=CAM_ASM_000212 /LENGTH=59 /DNA_ID=CAMNT_0001533137 /DNA_START=60 /DNA_END=236 /DNA_ORIENTATION=+